jgi:hypothetical protein
MAQQPLPELVLLCVVLQKETVLRFNIHMVCITSLSGANVNLGPPE